MTNKHGLSRTIPSDIKRIVRQQSGFGCVICGKGIIQYEHVDPEFHDATEHDPRNITLLCPQCHSKVTTGFWSKEKVFKAMAAPVCKSQGFSKEVFDVGHGHPALQVGGLLLKNCPTPIMVHRKALLKIEPAEETDGPFRLSGNFCDSRGKLNLEVIENEWRANSENWDVEVAGGAITIREGKGNISLKLIASPPDKIIVDRLNMFLCGYKIFGNGDCLKVTVPQGNTIELTGCLSDNCSVGLDLN